MKATQTKQAIEIRFRWRDLFRLAFTGDTPTVWRYPAGGQNDIQIYGPRSRFFHTRTCTHITKEIAP